MSKFCQNCGEKLKDTARFCKNCGANVENYRASENRFTTPADSKDNTILIVVGYLGALLYPLIGIILAIVLCIIGSEKAKMHAKYIIIFSVILWILSGLVKVMFY